MSVLHHFISAHKISTQNTHTQTHRQSDGEVVRQNRAVSHSDRRVCSNTRQTEEGLRMEIRGIRESRRGERERAANVASQRFTGSFHFISHILCA